MKSAIGVIVGLAFFAEWGTNRVSAADLDKCDWAQFKIELQPSPQLTWPENLAAHLSGVDRSLTLLRSESRRGERASTDKRRGYLQSPERLKNAYQFVGASLENSASHIGPVHELVQYLKEAEQIAHSVTQGKVLTREMFQTLQVAQGFVKMARHRLPRLEPTNALAGLDSGPNNQRTSSSSHQPAMIVELAVDVPPVHAYLEFPLRSTLLQLSVHNAEQRQQFVRRILEDENTRLLEMVGEPGSDPNAPSYLLFIAKKVELPSGELRTVRLPFRLTVEEVGTKGIWNKLRILTNTASDASVVVRSSLLMEVPVTNELSVTAYETCVTYSPPPGAEHRDKTLVTFAANMELTFYRHISSRLRDVSFRSVVASKCKSVLEQTKQQGVLRACEELTRQISHSIDSRTVKLTDFPPVVSASGH